MPTGQRPGVAMMAIARRRVQRGVVRGGVDLLCRPGRRLAVAAERHQHALADGDGVGPEGQRLGHVGPGANAAGDDQLHLAEDVHLVERLDGQRQGGQRRNAGVLDEHLLRRRRPSLHAVDDDDVGAGFDRQLDVVADARGPHLDVDRHLPVGDLPQFVES